MSLNVAEIIFRAKDETGTTFAKLRSEADGVRDSFTKVASATAAIAAVGAVAGAGIFAKIVKDGIEAADAMNDLSQRLGVATEAISVWQYAASQSGVSNQLLEGSIERLNKTLYEAAKGSKAATESLQVFGIDIERVKAGTLSTEEAFKQIAIRTSQAADGFEKSGALMKVFGRSASDLVPLLNEGGDGFKRLGDEAKRAGVIIGSDFARNADNLKDNLSKLNAGMQGLKLSIAEAVVPTLANMVGQLNAATQASNGFFSGLAKGITYTLKGFDLTKPSQEIENLKKKIEELQRGLLLKPSDKDRPTNYLGLPLRDEEIKEQLKKLEEQKKFLQNFKNALEPPVTPKDNPIVPPPKKPEKEKDKVSSFESDKRDLADIANNSELLAAALNKSQGVLVASIGSLSGLLAEEGAAFKLAANEANDLAESIGKVNEEQGDAAKQASGEDIVAQSIREKIKAIEIETALIGKSAREQEKWLAVRELNASGIEKETEAYKKFRAELEKSIDVKFDRIAAEREASQKYEAGQKAIEDARRLREREEKEFMAFSERIGDSFVDTWLHSLESGENGFNSFLRSIERSVAAQFARPIVIKFVAEILGAAKDSAGNGFLGEILDGLIKGVAGASGGGYGGGGYDLGGYGGGYGGRAAGGPAMEGKPYTIGERGPELFIPKTDGAVISNENLTRMLKSQNGDTNTNQVVVNNYVDARGADRNVDAKIKTAMAATSAQTIAAVRNMRARGRL